MDTVTVTFAGYFRNLKYSSSSHRVLLEFAHVKNGLAVFPYKPGSVAGFHGEPLSPFHRKPCELIKALLNATWPLATRFVPQQRKYWNGNPCKDIACQCQYPQTISYRLEASQCKRAHIQLIQWWTKGANYQDWIKLEILVFAMTYIVEPHIPNFNQHIFFLFF